MLSSCVSPAKFSALEMSKKRTKEDENKHLPVPKVNTGKELRNAFSGACPSVRDMLRMNERLKRGVKRVESSVLFTHVC